MNWILVKDQLPEAGKLVFIYVKYEDSPYDDVKEAISIGSYLKRDSFGSAKGIWENILDPFMDDGEISERNR